MLNFGAESTQGEQYGGTIIAAFSVRHIRIVLVLLKHKANLASSGGKADNSLSRNAKIAYMAVLTIPI